MTSEAQMSWLSGADETARRIRAHDWARTPLGPATDWPQSLRTAIGIMLGASCPAALCWGPEHVLLYNDAWRVWFGALHPGALGRPARDVFPDAWEALSGVLASGAASPRRLPLGKAGEREEDLLDCSAGPVLLEDGSVGGVFLIGLEATSRADAELRREAAHYRLLFDSIDEGFCVIEVLFDAEGNPKDYRFLEVNPSFERQTGLVGAVGKCMRELAPAHEEHWFEIYGRIAKTGVPERFEQAAEALHRYYDVYAFRIGEPHERKVAILFNDVSRRNRAERELRKTAEFEKQLIGIVSHDLRQPLLSIGLAASSLLRRSDLSEAVRTAAARIVAGTDRMGRMLMDLLDFTQARLGGGLPLQRTAVDLATLAERIVDDARLIHADREVDLAVQGDVTGEWDEDRLAQVLTNLVSNAISYSPEETRVLVEVRGEGPCVVVRVQNGGPPIPNEFLPRLFEPMQRAQPRKPNVRRSIGLGLFIVKHVVEAHGGRIEVRSSAEEGTTFTVRLPRRNG